MAVTSDPDGAEPLAGASETADGGEATGSPSVRPAASSWRMTRSGRNSSRCRRRIVRSRVTSVAEYSR